MLLFYANEKGILRFGNGNELWNIINYSGLSLAEKTFKVISYAESPGQVTLKEKMEARHITLRGDCRAEKAELSAGLRILNRPGTVFLIDGENVRKIGAYCSHLELQKRRGPFREFIIQFTADNPFFEGEEAVTRALYSREDLISGRFVLPCIFTRRIMTSMVFNDGDVEAEPILTVVCKKQGESDETGLFIENLTTGFNFYLDYQIKTDEIVTIDVPKRRIYSNFKTEENNEGNLIYCLSKETVLKNMYLVAGENQFKVTNFSPGSDVLVTCSFTEKYLEAIV